MPILKIISVPFFRVVVVASVFFAFGAHAQERVDAVRDWDIWTMKQNGKKICYIANSNPIKSKGNFRKRSAPYVLVTHIKKGVDEVSVSSGYPYKNNEITSRVDNKKKYKLFTEGELAWAYDQRQDKDMIKSMKRGYVIEVHGKSKLNSYSKDRFSLRGFTKAYKRMKELCRK